MADLLVKAGVLVGTITTALWKSTQTTKAIADETLQEIANPLVYNAVETTEGVLEDIETFVIEEKSYKTLIIIVIVLVVIAIIVIAK